MGRGGGLWSCVYQILLSCYIHFIIEKKKIPKCTYSSVDMILGILPENKNLVSILLCVPHLPATWTLTFRRDGSATGIT